MSSDCEMYDPRELYPETESESDCDCESESDSESEHDYAREIEEQQREIERLRNTPYEYTVTFKVTFKTIGDVNKRISELIDEIIKDGVLKRGDIDISGKPL